MIGVAVLMGFRPTAGLLVLLVFAPTWLAVATGLTSKTPEAASNTPMLIQFPPFVGSTFVPAASMPAGVRQFAEYQPFTPVTETVRGLLPGTPIGHDRIVAPAWCVAVAPAGCLWARAAFRRDRAHYPGPGGRPRRSGRPKAARRLNHAIATRPWRRRLVQDFGYGLAHEMFGIPADKIFG